MGCAFFILNIASCFTSNKSCQAGVISNGLNIPFNLFKAVMTHKICKALIKPKIIPPFHCDKISKPMMRQLMRYSISQNQHIFIRDFFFKDLSIIKCDNTCIFHCSSFVIMSKYLIVFIKGIRNSKEFFEEFKTFNSDLENERGKILHILEQRIDTIKGHWDITMLLLFRKLNPLIRSSNKTKEICWEHFGFWENFQFKFMSFLVCFTLCENFLSVLF